jgi:hypothetical protein
MNAGDSEPPRDPDDWFDEPQPVPPRRPRRPPVQADPDAQTREHAAMPADDWLAPESLTRKQRPARMPPIGSRRTLAALGIATCALPDRPCSRRRLLGHRQEEGERATDDRKRSHNSPDATANRPATSGDAEARRPRQRRQAAPTRAQLARLHNRNDRRCLRALDRARTGCFPNRAPPQPRRRPRPSHTRRTPQRATARMILVEASRNAPYPRAPS